MKSRISGNQFFLWYMPHVVLQLLLKLHLATAPWGAVVALLYFISIPVAIVAAVRRSHDLGHSGWFALICLIPFAGWYLVLKSGNPEANQYGPPPGRKEGAESPTSLSAEVNEDRSEQYEKSSVEK